MISSQTYFASPANAAKNTSQALRFSLRGNRKINQALRAAYRKFDRTAETETLLRKRRAEHSKNFIRAFDGRFVHLSLELGLCFNRHIKQPNADNLSPKCHWTALRRLWHRFLALAAHGAPMRFSSLFVSARTRLLERASMVMGRSVEWMNLLNTSNGA
jgi:hypothetical protein